MDFLWTGSCIQAGSGGGELALSQPQEFRLEVGGPLKVFVFHN